MRAQAGTRVELGGTVMLDERKSAILQALVEEHIRTGEPVSSRAILDASGLGVSSATIRNELVVLEREGYVSQPHTSAGRVPNDQTYRYYVDHISPIRLRAATRSRIDGFFHTVHRQLELMLQETSNLLADITNYPALVVGPGMQGDLIHSVNLVRLGPALVLVVLVSESGRVAKELARLGTMVTPAEIDLAEQLLADALTGKPLDAGASAAVDHDQLSAGVADVVRAAAEAARRTEGATRDLYFGGTSQLTSLWMDLEKVHSLLEFLEQQAHVMTLLQDAGDGTSVRIGAEVGAEVDDVAMVATTYDAGDSGRGRVGVLGPKRMDYRRTIKVVEEVGDGLADSLGG
jgi:heat-inducible transcriptional repressor